MSSHTYETGEQSPPKQRGPAGENTPFSAQPGRGRDSASITKSPLWRATSRAVPSLTLAEAQANVSVEERVHDGRAVEHVAAACVRPDGDAAGDGGHGHVEGRACARGVLDPHDVREEHGGVVREADVQEGVPGAARGERGWLGLSIHALSYKA